jgi:hypothetical protein
MITFARTAALKAELNATRRYTRRHDEPVDAVTLIPHMPEVFTARDRGFRRAGRSRDASKGSHNS